MPLGLDTKSWLSTATISTKTLNPKFQVLVSCLLQRPPVTMRALNNFETEYEKYRLMLEQETSRGIFQIKTSGSSSTEADEDHPVNSISRHIAQNEDTCDDMVKASIGPGLRKEYLNLPSNDLRRELDRKLYLLIKDKVSGQWSLPSNTLMDASTDPAIVSRQSLMDCFNVANADIYWTGRSPMAVIESNLEGRLKTPFSIRNFVFRAQLLGGCFGKPNGERVKEFMWATKQEAEQVLEPPLYFALKALLSE